jgi:heme exporter protein CcmD
MNHWPFIIAAYGLTLAATAGLVWQSWQAMRRAERRADALGKKP